MSLCVLDSTPTLAAPSSSEGGDNISSSPTTQWYKEKHEGGSYNASLYRDQASEDAGMLGKLQGNVAATMPKI